MATRLYLNKTRGTRGAGTPGTLPLDWTTAAGSLSNFGQITTVIDGTELQIAEAPAETRPLEWVTPRFAAQTTISGSITASIDAVETGLGANAGLRLKLFKLTAGGSDVLTQFATGDTTAELPLDPTTTPVVITMTPSTITVAEDERLVLRAFAIPAPSQTMGGGVVELHYAASTDSLQGFSWIEFTEALTFKVNGATLFLRRTAAAAIGNYFDMLPVRGGSAFTTGVVNTTAGGTDIPWTRTAGGTALEWISGRLRKGFRFDTFEVTSQYLVRVFAWALESATTANCTWRYRAYRYRAGVETQIAIKANPSELATTAGGGQISAASADITPIDFLPDDRFVLRMFLTNVGTMASGRTATVNYDHNVADVNGDSYFAIWDSVEFKDETEPDDPPTIPDGQSMSGIGN